MIDLRFISSNVSFLFVNSVIQLRLFCLCVLKAKESEKVLTSVRDWHVCLCISHTSMHISLFCKHVHLCVVNTCLCVFHVCQNKICQELHIPIRGSMVTRVSYGVFHSLPPPSWCICGVIVYAALCNLGGFGILLSAQTSSILLGTV